MHYSELEYHRIQEVNLFLELLVGGIPPQDSEHLEEFGLPPLGISSPVFIS